MPEERDKCLNNCNNAHTTGKINDDEFNECKKACPYAFGGRRTRKQRGGDTIGDTCFKDCIEAAGGTTDGERVILHRTAPRDTLMRCARKCHPGHSLYRATAKKLNPEA